MLYLRQSTASQADLLGPFVDDTDGKTAETGLTIANTDIRLSKDGGNMAAKNSGGGTHDEAGWYTVTFDATDTNTVGRLKVSVHVSGALPVFAEYQVVEESVYDALYASDAPGFATVAQVDNIASTGGAALAVEATEDNNGGAIIDSVTAVGAETGTYANTEADDSSYHVITHSGNAIDRVYGFTLGGGFVASSFTFKGYLTSSNDSINIQAWNGSTWDTRFILDGQNGTADVTETINLLSKHTNAGKVYLRFVCSSQSSPVLNTNLLLVEKVNTSRSVGYALGAIWIDTNASNTNTEDFVDGTADNPVSTITAAVTLSGSLGLQRFIVAAGSSITLAASAANYEFMGENYALAFGGQSIAGAHIQGATVSGTFTGSTGILEHCVINAITGPGLTMRCCYFNEVTVTNNGTDGWFLNDCRSRVAGSGSMTFDYGDAVGSTGVSIRAYSGGIAIENMGDTGTDTMSLEGDGAVTEGTCSGGALSLRGNFKENNITNITVTRDEQSANSLLILEDTGTTIPALIGTPAADLAADIAAVKSVADAIETEIGTAGAGLTDLGGMSTAMKAEVNAEVVDTLATDTYSEPTGVPAATASLASKIGRLHMEMRNQVTATATKKTVFDDAGNPEYEYDLSDDGSTATESKANSV